MRLWHYKLLEYLPKSQLIAQKRECDLIFKDILNGRKTNHILINYIWDYPLDDLLAYYWDLSIEFDRRKIKFNKKYFMDMLRTHTNITYKEGVKFENHHNNEYMMICYYNLKEKYLRGQKDFDAETFERLKEFVLKTKF